MEMEDKKCRICGQADIDNFNIFQSKTLPAKIVAVYPIALYRNDPLPKHICKKCHVSTHNMYNEMERSLRNQSKWITNIRLAQPDNQYLKVVDSIAGANKQTSQLVSLIAGSEIGERTISKLFNFETDNYTIPKRRPAQNENPLPESDKTDENEDSSADFIESPPLIATASLSKPPDAKITKPLPLTFKLPPLTATAKPSKPPEAKITQLKSVLELNGCTLTKVKPTIKSTPGSQKKKEDNSLEETEIDIKEEPLEDQVLYNQPVLLREEQSAEEPMNHGDHHVKCKMCPFSCETIEEQAIHQLEHLKLSTWKLSERRILHKRTRRGRLIMVEEKKCIRCLNCWRIFADNKSILQHWSEGDCDFFCQICGKEFAISPKMLREHIPAAHGISYRSSKILRPPTLVPRKPSKVEKSFSKSFRKSITIKTEPSSSSSQTTTKKSPVKNKSPKPPPNGSLTVKVACSICLKVFANFKARNSHMRAHKHPPFLPAQPPPSLNETLIALNRTDILQIKDEPLDLDNTLFQGIKPQEAAAPSTSRAGPAFTKVNKPTTKHPRLKVLPTRTTGVRKKNVQIPSSVIAEPLKVKSLADLQDPAVTSQLPETSDKFIYGETQKPISTSTPSSNGGAPPLSINGLSMDFDDTPPPKDNMNYSQIFTCHPCGLKFNSKLELFRHKRKCSANNLFSCQFCEKHFITSADLQMHIMLLHKSSSTISQ